MNARAAQNTFLSNTNSPTDRLEPPALAVQILYEDFPTGLRAKKAFDDIAEHLGAGPESQVALWRFDLLQEPALGQEVAHAAMRADVVLLSAHGQHGLPEAVQTWLTGWLKRASDEPPALVVLLDAAAERTISAHHWLAALQLQARPAGVELFPHFGDLSPQPGGGWSQTDNKMETTTAVLAKTLRQPGTYLQRHWGLND